MNIPRQLISVLLLPLIVISLVAYTPVTAANEQCFPETGFCISGRFRTFWEQQGGLAVFGFPVAAPRNEVNQENGQTYLTQWFERVRFELHPEHAPPYDVLLGRIGDDRLQLQGVTWQTLPQASGPQAGCLWFAETGHNVCDQAPGLGFKQYWQAHGLLDPLLDQYGRSLALFGLPLSEATVEINPTDGAPYVTQWFERARFEWHPEQTDAQYKVLLGLLGNEVLLAPRQIGANNAGFVAARGTTAAWVELEGSNRTTLYTYSTATLTRTPIVSSAGTKTGVSTDGRFIVWVDTPPGALSRIQQYDISSGQQRTLLTAQASDEQYGQLAIADGVLYFEQSAPTQRGLFALDLNSGAQRIISPSGRNPVAAEGFLLWTESSSSGTGFDMRTTHRLFLRTLDGSRADLQLAQIEDQNGFSRYDIANNRAVWAGYGSAVSVYDVSTGNATMAGSNAFRPTILNQHILWASPAQAGQWSISYQDLLTGKTSTIVTEAGLSWNFVGVADNAIVYTRVSAQGTEEVYLRRFP